MATAPLGSPSAATAPAIPEGTPVPVARASELAMLLPEAPPEARLAAAIISVLQQFQIRVLQAVQNSRVAAEPIAAAELQAPPAIPKLSMAETVEIGPGSAAAAEPAVAPPTDVPENIEGALAASVQQLCDCKQLEAGYVKLLRDSMPDNELLLARLQWMVSQGNERCINGNLLFRRIQYLYGNQDGPFHRRSRTTSSTRPGGGLK
jgi:hypothetical protein